MCVPTICRFLAPEISTLLYYTVCKLFLSMPFQTLVKYYFWFSGYRVGLRSYKRVPKELLTKAGGAQICRNVSSFCFWLKQKFLKQARKLLVTQFEREA